MLNIFSEGLLIDQRKDNEYYSVHDGIFFYIIENQLKIWSEKRIHGLVVLYFN